MKFQEPSGHNSSLSSPSCEQDFQAFQVLEGELSAGILFVADHASAGLPQGYGSLGLNADQFERHIAYDIGIEGVARQLNKRLNVPVVMSCFSRLLIDPNRGANDPTLIMKISDGAIIPDNAQINEAETAHRIAAYYQPYHDAITAKIEEFLALNIRPIIISLHSFTHDWRGTLRPWHAGILWDQDDRFVAPLLDALRADPELTVGDNQPYTGQLYGDCMHRHGTSRGLAHALIEIRQDLISSAEGQEAWAERLSSICTELLQKEEIIALTR